MNFILILSTLFALEAKSAIVKPVTGSAANSDYSYVVLDSIWGELGHPAMKKIEPPSPSPEPAPEPIPTPGKKEVVKNEIKKRQVMPTPPPAPAPKKLSPGQKKIQEILARNKKKLQDRESQISDQEKMDQRAIRRAEKNGDFLTEMKLRNQQALTKLKRKNQETLSSWKSLQQETLSRWKKSQREFLSNLPHYKKATLEPDVFESASPVLPAKKLNRPIQGVVKGKYHIIKGAIDVPIKDQGKRPTCASFAGIRAIEILLRGNNYDNDLSEQYLYWASKPDCQNSPCTSRGSWIIKGFDRSRDSSIPDIPLEDYCPYSESNSSGNETQVPLVSGCQRGKVKIVQYETLDTLDDIKRALDNNRPVIGGFKLSANFYNTNGLVTYEESLVKGQVDSHAKGHALLLVGHMTLPTSKLGSEGKICFLTANSWGEGWGRGGHACLTEKWVRHYRIKNAFVALNSVRIE